MQIRFKLFATLSDYLPPHAKANAIDLDIAPGTTAQQLIEQYNLPQRMCHLVLINGFYIPPAERASVVLREHDVLAIWPPVAGG